MHVYDLELTECPTDRHNVNLIILYQQERNRMRNGYFIAHLCVFHFCPSGFGEHWLFPENQWSIQAYYHCGGAPKARTSYLALAGEIQGWMQRSQASLGRHLPESLPSHAGLYRWWRNIQNSTS
jgi:hypothetical protein